MSFETNQRLLEKQKQIHETNKQLFETNKEKRLKQYNQTLEDLKLQLVKDPKDSTNSIQYNIKQTEKCLSYLRQATFVKQEWLNRSPEKKPLLEPLTDRPPGYKTLVFDLDGTLWDTMGYDPHRVRPGVHELLAFVKDHFELVLFTTSPKSSESVGYNVNDALSQIDPDRTIFKYVLTEDSCSTNEVGFYIKDLSLLGRPLESVILVEDTMSVCELQPRNVIAVDKFMGDQNDKELYSLAMFLLDLVLVDDVRDHVGGYRKWSVEYTKHTPNQLKKSKK